MPAFDATFYADCEIIIRAFEKGAAFSNDPRSVYALNTPILSKGIANCNALDKQIGIQFENSEKRGSLGINEPGFTQGVISNESRNQTTASQAENAHRASQRQDEPPPADSGTEASQSVKSETPTIDQNYSAMLEQCVPCKERFQGAEFAIRNFGKSWEAYGDLWRAIPENFVRQMEQMVDLLKDRGRSTLQGLCEFIKSFQLMQCPSDLMRIIAALSAALTKLSLDLFGDLGMFLNLAKGILTPLLSAAVQLIQNFLQKIIDPIMCLIDSFQKEFIGPIADMMEMTSNLQGPWDFGTGFKSTMYDQDWSLQQVPAPMVPPDSLFAPDNPPSMVQGPFKTKPKEVASAIYNQPDTGSYQRYAKRQEEITQLGASKPKPGTKQYEKLQEKLKEHKAEKFNKNISDLKKFNDTIENAQSSFQNIFDATFTHLNNIATFIQNLFDSWIEELARLIGGSAVVEIGFYGKSVQKLSLITLIGTFTALLKFLQEDNPCDSPDDILENIIQESFSPMTDAIVKKEEDGTLSVVFGIFDTDMEPSPQYTYEDTGDEEMNITIENLARQIEEPAPATIFSCRNSVPRDADAHQINKWIAELETAGI